MRDDNIELITERVPHANASSNLQCIVPYPWTLCYELW